MQLNWSNGDVRMELSAALHGDAICRVTLHASEATLLKCPRQAPWGWSVSVNEVRCASTQDGRTRLEVEIQSGDALEV